ncbi:WG repeat-containing protein [Desulfobacterota bacterium AH_259_B03_O07]|nr:WG repeat-containing protein [Desulfobacterota bacterium AH_259_B03_O07]
MLRKSVFFFLLIYLLVVASSCNEKESKQEMIGSIRLYPVILNGKVGYINDTGKIVIKPQFDGASIFSEGLAFVEINGKVGHINRAGKIVIK